MENAKIKVRYPLDHDETDALAKRIYFLFGVDALNDDERGLLSKKYAELRKVDFRLARHLFDRPLPSTTLRPKFYDDARRPLSGCFGRDEIDVMAGWVHRLREYVDLVEQRHSRSTVSGDDDI